MYPAYKLNNQGDNIQPWYTPFQIWNQSVGSMSSSNCCFLTCIQVSQEIGQVVWYSHLFKNFPQFVGIHRVKGFGVVSKSEVDVFLDLSYFFDDPTDVGNLVPLPFISLVVENLYCWSSGCFHSWLLWNSCNFCLPVGGGEFRVFLLYHLVHLAFSFLSLWNSSKSFKVFQSIVGKHNAHFSYW